MEWQPINHDELMKIIQREINEFPIVLRTRFNRLPHDLIKINCSRGENIDDEEVFSIIRSSDNVLIFDDVEEEFGVARLWRAADQLEIGSYFQISKVHS